jgi:putative transposase
LQVLRNALRAVRSRHPFRLDAIVVLPDHLHAIMTLPPGDADYARRWSLIKRQVSQASRDRTTETQSASRRKRRELDFWQRRFWEHAIRDDADYARHVDYLHFNPVKHGLVSRVTDWPYSTFHRFVRLGIYSADWAGAGADEADVDYGEVEG